MSQVCSQSAAGLTRHKAVTSKKATLQILPCTVSQLLSAPHVSNDSFAICDWELNQVSVVGVIRGLSPFVTNIQYSVDDMTGPPLHVKQWVNAEDCAVMTFASPGTYVKIIGNLRNFSGQRSLLAMNIRCIQDPNEITSHMLEVVQAHMQLFGKVLHVIQKFSDRDVGISFHDLRTQLDYLSMRDIRCSLTFLINEGHVFSTIDEQHFKST
ncbi:replication protein A 32 kDa subunit-like isoform X2 [Trachinotus anak]|uniref:replication protein A 32 kDa subunit-like isoform X2 n=1 Tax=Trachinotus anak TaxID=443729 RepID=UPI0039F1A9F8